MRQRLSASRVSATSLLITSIAMALVLAAPVVAGSTAGITSGVVESLRAFGAGSDPAPMAARARIYQRTGIDVSHWQGSIDWQRVADSGIDFAIIKATDGANRVDPWYERNRTRARRAGIATTAYHFARPGLSGVGSRHARIVRDARLEARFFVRQADLRRGDLIPALDLERSGGLRPSELRTWTLAFLRTVRGAIGARPMVYSNAYFWRTHMGDTAKVARAGFRFWVAHWGARTPEVPGRRWLEQGWTFWQWTDCGRVPGIDDCVDRNSYSSTKALRTLTIGRQQVDAR